MEEERRDTALSLGLGYVGSVFSLPTDIRRQPLKAPTAAAPPSLTLSLSDEIIGTTTNLKTAAIDNYANKAAAASPVRVSSPHSTVSSFSIANIKKVRDTGGAGEDAEVERGVSRASDEDEELTGTRKKLRLTKEQSALLEDKFKEHSTLNTKQKQALAKQLNLRPRQVEVWFQNRRARTKLKQTEVDCEFLKRCCETLKEENRRLQKELHELKTLKFCSPPPTPPAPHLLLQPPPPFFRKLPPATLKMCPSCQRVGGAGGKLVVAGGGAYTAASTLQPTYFLNPFSHSAAC